MNFPPEECLSHSRQFFLTIFFHVFKVFLEVSPSFIFHLTQPCNVVFVYILK